MKKISSLIALASFLLLSNLNASAQITNTSSVVSPGPLTITADVDNAGGAAQRIDFATGAGANTSIRASIVGDRVGISQPNPEAAIHFGGTTLGGATQIMRIDGKEPGAGDIGLVQTSTFNAYTPMNPVFTGSYDQVFKLGYNVAPSGKQVDGEHLFSINNESKYVTAEGRAFNEFYLEYVSRGGDVSYRPFGITIDLDTNASTLGLYADVVVIGDRNQQNPWLVFGNSPNNEGTFQILQNGKIDFADRTTPIITMAGQNLFSRASVNKFKVFEGSLSNDDTVNFFSKDSINAHIMTLTVGGVEGPERERGIRWIPGGGFQVQYPDASWRYINDEVPSYLQLYQAYRLLGKNVGDTVELGTLTGTTVNAEIEVKDFSSSIAQSYRLVANGSNYTGTDWRELTPTYTTGYRNGENIAVDVKQANSQTLVRFRRTASSNTSVANITAVVKYYGRNFEGVFVPSEVTGSNGTIIGQYAHNALTQGMSRAAFFGLPQTDGTQTIFIGDTEHAPTTNPQAGGLLYSEGGALKWRSPGGRVTTIAPN
jgi:hypothetical protein